jgi:hypothetical protein
MNEILIQFARQNLKEGLAKCSPAQVMLFKRMYSHENLETEINSVVDNMPEEKLDWAMQQVQRTLKEAEKL